VCVCVCVACIQTDRQTYMIVCPIFDRPYILNHYCISISILSIEKTFFL